MHSSVWVKLLRQVPADQHDNLMLVTAAGTEIAIQCVLRIDHEFLAVRGRLAGSQDAGRLFFLPYARIDYLGFQKPVKEAEFHDMFGSLEVPVPTPAAPPPAAAAAPSQAPAPAPDPAPDPGPRCGPTPIKSAVLERFRQRSVTASGTTLRPSSEG